MGKKEIVNLTILFAVVAGLLMPFVGKPFNIDEPFYLTAANQFLRDPVRPYSYSINWSGELRNAWGPPLTTAEGSGTPPLAGLGRPLLITTEGSGTPPLAGLGRSMEATFPPLITAYTALIIKVSGEKEWALHLFFLIFPVTAVFSMYYISRKYVEDPLVPALLFAVCPAFLVSSTSIMLDVPLCALMLCSVALFIYGVDSESRWKILLGSLIAGCAVLAKYSGILVVPIIFFYLYFSKRLKYWAYLLVPFAFLAAWSLHNELVYGGVHFLLASKHIGKGISLHKIFAFGTFFSGCFIFPVALLFAASLKETRALIIWLIVLFVFAKVALGGLVTPCLFALFCAATLYFIFRAAAERNRLDGFVLAWFFTGLLAAILLEPWLAARYLVIMLAPAAIIFAKILESLPGERGNMIKLGSLSVAFVLGISLCVSDYLWADSYKKAAQYIKNKGYNTGYFLGHFGFQYYLEKTGMTALEVNKPLAGGGYLVAARVPDPQQPSREIAGRLKLLELRHLESRFPVRIMNPKNRAGFYSSFWGILPFNFSTLPVDDIAVYQITEGKGR